MSSGVDGRLSVQVPVRIPSDVDVQMDFVSKDTGLTKTQMVVLALDRMEAEDADNADFFLSSFVKERVRVSFRLPVFSYNQLECLMERASLNQTDSLVMALRYFLSSFDDELGVSNG